MENLDILNTTSYVAVKGEQDKLIRVTAPKKVKLRPTSKDGINENLAKFPKQKDQEEVPTATVEVPKEVVNSVSAPEVAPMVSEISSNNVVTPDLQPPVVPSGSITQENKEVLAADSKVAGLSFYTLGGKVSTLNDALPKGLKLKEEKEKNMIAQAPAPLFTVVGKIENVEITADDEFQTVELQLGENSKTNDIDVPTMNSEFVFPTSEIGSGEVSSSLENDEMQEIEPMSINEVKSMGEDMGMEEIPASDIKREFAEKQETKNEESEQRKAVVPIYELCEAIDIQREKTREAELKASQLTIDFQKYKEQSQQEIDESYREVKEAGDSQTEAEARYQIAEQEHRSALQNLIDTGKNQQRMLQQRQKEADAQVKAVVQERKVLEQTNNTTLAQNKVQLQKYLNHTIELNEQTQIKNEQKAKWEAIAKAMQDPEEDLMGYISPDDIYEVEPDALSKSYGRRTA